MTIEEKRVYLLDYIHQSTQALEFFSDLELLSMDNYELLITEAEENIKSASDSEIDDWYDEWS